MSTSRGKCIPCHPQCTRCEGVLVSRSTKARHTKDIQDQLVHDSTTSAPKATIPTFAEWNSLQRFTRGNDEEGKDDDSHDGNSSGSTRAVKRVRRTSPLDPVCYFKSICTVYNLIFERMMKI
jgi:hypothetical protein